jgi:hypothetical protein
MSAIGDRVSQLSSAASVYGAQNGVAGADGQINSGADGAIGALHQLDDMTRLQLVGTRSSTGGQITSAGQANTVAFSTGPAPFGIASTRYQCSGQP